MLGVYILIFRRVCVCAAKGLINAAIMRKNGW